MSKDVASGDFSGGAVKWDTLRLAAQRAGAVHLHDARHRMMMSRRHAHREWELNLVTRGWVEYVITDRRLRFATDTLIWLLPGQPHRVIDRSADLLMWVVVFRPEVARRLAEDEALGPWRDWLAHGRPRGPGHRVLGEAPARRLGELCRRLNDAPPGPAHEAAGLAWLAAEAWEAFSHARDVPEGTHLHPAVQRAAQLLHDEPGRDDLNALARDCHISRPHLSRLFREQLGQSITDYRNRQRVERLGQLVGRGGRLNLTHAAYAAGFGSYAQAYRVTRRLTGQSPRAWLGGWDLPSRERD